MPDRLTPDNGDHVFPVLLAGGTGTRLWPVSRQLYPKQLVKFIGDDSLIQNTIKRMRPIVNIDNIRIVCGLEHFHEIARHMKEVGVTPDEKIIAEPCGRNTAPAIMLAMLNVININEDAVISVFPADHVIKDDDQFRQKVKIAVNLAEKGYIVTFGITPHYPETGYGYIEGGREIGYGALKIKRFVEKPDKPTAVQYIKAGNFFWNSGMFTFKVSVMLEEIKRYEPDLYAKMVEMFLQNPIPRKTDYEKMPNISIDYAVMEKTRKAAVLPSDFGWSDIGSWKSLFDFLPKDGHNNVADGDVILNDTRNCFILGKDRLVAVNHVENLVIVDTPDSVFVSDIENSRDVKDIVSQLRESGRRECYQHITVNYPWGTVTVLEEADGFDVDRITIFPKQTLQLPANFPPPQHITVANGRALVSGGHGEKELIKGASFTITDPDNTAVYNPDEGPVNIIAIRSEP